MSLRDLVFWAYRQCRTRLFESILIIVAVGLGVGVIVSVLALFNGVRIQQATYLRQPTYRMVRMTAVEDIAEVLANATSPLLSIATTAINDRVQFTLDDIRQLKVSFPNSYAFVQQSAMYQLDPSMVSYQEVPIQTGFRGGGNFQENNLQVILTTPDFFPFMDFSLHSGTFFMQNDLDQGNRVMILGSAMAERLFADENAVGKDVLIAGDDKPYSVLGVLAPTSHTVEGRRAIGDFNLQVFIPVTSQPQVGNTRFQMAAAGNQMWGAVQQMAGGANTSTTFSELRVGVADGANLGVLLREVRQYASLAYGDLVSIYAPYEELQNQQQRNIFMGMIVALFASIGLLIAAVNILTLMLARILRRTRGIGISMALGANRKAIFFQFLVEACLLGVVGSVLGVAISYGGVHLVSILVDEPISHTFMVQLIGILISLGISLIFGVYPAYQGAQIRPVDALRSV